MTALPKPRLFRHTLLWCCDGEGASGVGWTPGQAYRRWCLDYARREYPEAFTEDQAAFWRAYHAIT